jgi:regulatory protein YycH of two-component signal transduction system YycFG
MLDKNFKENIKMFILAALTIAVCVGLTYGLWAIFS